MGKLIKLLGGAAIIAYVLKSRGIIGGGQTATPEPFTSPAAAPAPAPSVANADVAGPPANTATAVPAPDPVVTADEGSIDEVAEEHAAAAEAANIGGPGPDYPATDGEGTLADEAEAPLVEAGEGESEGQEVAEADLVENAEPAAGDPVEGERQVEETIEAQDDRTAGEVIEADAPPPTGPPVDLAPPPIPAPPPDDKSTAVWKSEEQATIEQPAVPEDDA